MKIKNIIFPFPPDSSTDILDVLIVLEEDSYWTDSFSYVLEVSTPQGLANLVQEDNFLPPTELIIIVRELTKEIIEEAIQALVEAREDAYWLKLYHAAGALDINHLNNALRELKNSAVYPKVDLFLILGNFKRLSGNNESLFE